MSTKSMRGAPAAIRAKWARTGMSDVLCMAYDLLGSWEEADARLSKTYARWNRAGVYRYGNRVVQRRFLEAVRRGAKWRWATRPDEQWPARVVMEGGGTILPPPRQLVDEFWSSHRSVMQEVGINP